MGEYETVEVPTSADEEPMKLVRFGGLSRVDEDGSVQSVHAGELLFAVESETAAEIADLISIELDMRNALGYATEYPAHEEEEGTLASALFEAAIITYGRSFRQGKSAQPRKGQNGKGAPRLKATAYLDVLPQRLLRMHEELLELRDKHVGHRVDHETSAVVAEFTGDGEFLYASPLLWSLGSSGEHMAAIREIAELLLPRLHEEIGAKTEHIEQTLEQVRLSRGSDA